MSPVCFVVFTNGNWCEAPSKPVSRPASQPASLLLLHRLPSHSNLRSSLATRGQASLLHLTSRQTGCCNHALVPTRTGLLSPASCICTTARSPSPTGTPKRFSCLLCCSFFSSLLSFSSFEPDGFLSLWIFASTLLLIQKGARCRDYTPALPSPTASSTIPIQ